MGPLLLLAALLAGLVASLCLSLLTSFVAYWGPHGGGYFLSGNSALQLSYELAPALVGGGWTVLALPTEVIGTPSCWGELPVFSVLL
jgi:hypothetical protein